MGNPGRSFMLSCQEVTEVVTDYLEGRMRLWDRLRFQFHLGICKGCRRYLNQLRTTAATIGKLPDDPVPPEIERALIDKFRNWKNLDQP